MAPDTCTKYKQNHHIILRDITTNTQTFMDKKYQELLKFVTGPILCYMQLAAYGT